LPSSCKYICSMYIWLAKNSIKLFFELYLINWSFLFLLKNWQSMKGRTQSPQNKLSKATLNFSFTHSESTEPFNLKSRLCFETALPAGFERTRLGLLNVPSALWTLPSKSIFFTFSFSLSGETFQCRITSCRMPKCRKKLKMPKCRKKWNCQNVEKNENAKFNLHTPLMS
jgi:hypothetical protein